MSSADRILRATGDSAEFRLVLVDCTQAANRIADSHGAKGYARQLLGEAVAASLLVASGLKGPGTAQLRAELSGDISRLAADATPLGLVRAMIPQEEILRMGGFEPMVLPRTLTVRKLDRDGRTLAEGIVEMVAPDLSSSLSHYLRQSEQSRAGLRVSAACREPDALAHAGGLLLEGFPGFEEADWKKLEPSLALRLEEFAAPESGLRLEELMTAAAGPFAARVHQEFEVEPYCPCSEAGVLRALSGLGRDELENLYFAGEDTELFCEFCRRRYLVGPEKLKGLLDAGEAAGGPADEPAG